MLEFVAIEQLDEIYDRLAFPYRVYCRADDERAPSVRFFKAGSGTSEIRARKDWNRLG